MSDDAPEGHDGDDIGEALGLLDVMGGHEHGDAACAQGVDERPELLAHLRIEPDGGLVEQHQARLMDEPARDEQAPAHATGELAHDGLRARHEVGDLQGTLYGGWAFGGWHTVEARKDREDLPAGELDVEVVELGHDPHGHAGLLGFARQHVPEHLDLAGIGEGLRGEQTHGGGLAGAVGAEQAKADAGGHLQVEPVDGGNVAEALDGAA